MTICELDLYVLCTIGHLAWLTGWYEDSNCSLIIDGVMVSHECMTSGVFAPRTNNNIFCYTVADGVQSSMKCVSVVYFSTPKICYSITQSAMCTSLGVMCK